MLLTACQKRGEECQRFIGTVNRSLREIDARPQPKPDDLQAVARHRTELAKKYQSLAVEVQGLAITEPELTVRAKRYSELAKAAAEALTDGVKAVQAQDPEKADLSQQRFDQVAKAESQIVSEINSLCLGDAGTS